MIFYYFIVFTLPIAHHRFLNSELALFSPIKFLGLACVPFAIYRGFTRANLSGLSKTGVIPSFAIWFFFILLSHFAHGSAFELDRRGFNPLEAVFAMLFFILLTVALVDTFERFRWVLLIMMASVAVASVYAVRELLVNLQNPGYRPGGITGDANYFGVCASTCMVVGLHLLLTRRPRWEKLYLLGCLVTISVAFLLAASRGGFVALAVGILYLTFRAGRGLRTVVLISMLLTPLLLVVPNVLVQRMLNPGGGDKDGIVAREIAWKAGLRMVGAHPFIGVGVSRFENLAHEYEKPDETLHGLPVWSMAHNTYLEIAAETGIFGLLGYLALMISGYRALGRIVRSKSQFVTPRLRDDCLAFQAGFVTAAICTFFVSAWWFRFIWLVLFLPACLPAVEQSLARGAPVTAAEADLEVMASAH
jgi:putative inorganic carbon (hco3(-)) transporter